MSRKVWLYRAAYAIALTFAARAFLHTGCYTTQRHKQSATNLYVGVLSRSSNSDARLAIRKTWGGHPALHLVRFFLAQASQGHLIDKVTDEALIWNDMVILQQIAEHYENITHQTLELFRFAAADPRVTHVLKTDDDCFVRIELLLTHLALFPRSALYWGTESLSWEQVAHRDEVSAEEWAPAVWPPYAYGVGYVLSVDLARHIATGAVLRANGGRVIRSEDVAVGMWLRYIENHKSIRIHRTFDPAINYNMEFCDDQNIISHKITPSDQYCMWKSGGQCCNTVLRN